ncbi:TolC family protein [Propionivibrio sp.]|uniref:TolC family protein n=1 Tax=Propionivibrio sp. TaxID=2212460 RepID=UPI003BF01A3D
MKMKSLALAIASAFIAAGCAVKPVAITDEAHLQRAADDQRRLFAEQDPVSAPFTLADAITRALKYNMDYRTRLMEEAASLGQTELASFDLLPKLTAAAGYTTRDNEAFGYGYTPTGSISTVPSAAAPMSHSFNSLSFSWNVLDFGLSYLRAKQLADQSMISEERRRKAVQNLIQDVRNAWWRVEAAQRLLPESDALLAEVDQAAARARLIETRKLLPPLQIVAYKRSLLDLEQQISVRRQELAQSKLELAQLLNLRPGLDYTVATPRIDDPTPPDLTAKIETLEQIAVHNRPELREEGYRARITDVEGNKLLLSMLPSLGLDTGTNYDSNKYLVNNRWASAGLNLSWNLMKLLSLPSQRRANESAARIDETRRLALTAAVLAQTRIAAVRYRLLTQEFAIWDDAVNDDGRIVGYLNASKQVGLETELELIRAKARGMISKINRDLVYANVQGAIGRIYNSIGLDSLPLDVETHAPEALAAQLAATIEGWEGATFAPKAATTRIPVAVVRVEGLSTEDGDAFTTSLHRILRLSKIATVGANQPAPYRIESAVVLKSPGVSGQPSLMRLKLIDQDGAVLFEAEQNSMLMTPVGPDQWRALGEGAAYRVIDPVRLHLSKAGLASASTLTARPSPTVDEQKVPTAQTLGEVAVSLKIDTATSIADAIKRGEDE